jgi:hypothetical protein
LANIPKHSHKPTLEGLKMGTAKWQNGRRGKPTKIGTRSMCRNLGIAVPIECVTIAIGWILVKLEIPGKQRDGLPSACLSPPNTKLFYVAVFLIE